MEPRLPPSTGVPRIAVLIATCDRPDLLARRSLPSVLAQSRCPDLVVVVDDSAPETRARNADAVEELRTRASFPILLVGNERSPGASGAWNAGIDCIRATGDPAETFVAILDDDDEWTPDHLQSCAGTLLAGGLSMTASSMLRIEDTGRPGRQQDPPATLRVEDFLVGNPHIQGSNLLVRTDVLLAAGCFDEALPSSTDRDLCIRIADLGWVRYAPTPHATVRHYAEPTRPRLSTPGSRRKHNGLDRFWRKYRGRMTGEQQEAFKDRAARLFNWYAIEPTEDGVALVVGIVADAATPERVAPLLEDLVALGAAEGVAGLDVVLVENGPRPTDGVPDLRDLVSRARDRGLRCFLVEVDRQQEDAACGRFGEPFDRGTGRCGIAKARTMVQSYAYALARRRPGAVVWILDDDKHLGEVIAPAGGRNGLRALVPTLLRFRSEGVSVVLGVDEDSPPLPTAATLRVQAVDLFHNLSFFAGLHPDCALPDRSHENSELRHRSRDYYYDLARNDGAHLETPCWWTPEAGETVRQAFHRLADRVPRIFAGEQVFRPLVPDKDEDPVTTSSPSVHRGGNTFIIDAEVLAEAPNLALEGDCETTRRSDMIWALLHHHRGHRVMRAELPVRHDRTTAVPVGVDLREFAKDIRGHALYMSLRGLLEGRMPRREPGDLRFDTHEIDTGVESFFRYLRHRIEAVRAAFARVQGVAGSVERLLDPVTAPGIWWHGDEDAIALRRVREVASRLAAETGPERLTELERDVLEVSPESIRRFLGTLHDKVARYREALASREALYAELDRQRIEIARSQIVRLAGAPTSLRPLGTGAEGVAFTDGQRVYKSFDYWRTRSAARQRGFLRGLVGRLQGTRALYPIENLHEDGVHAVLVYPFEAGEPFRGGHGPGLVRLLRECREHGLVCNNLTPDNLRVTSSGLRLIDYGADIVPWTPEGFESMCRRAWLCWRWWFRSDLRELMQRSIREGDLPELSGMEGLREALSTVDGADRLYDQVASAVAALRPRTVLDYGCGKAKLARMLAGAGMDVTGWDPDPALPARWRQDGDGPRLGGAELRARLVASGKHFDAVVCSLVLCALPDGPEYELALAELRSLVDPTGHVIVAVCNPWHVTGPDTPWMSKSIHPGAALGDSFEWTYTGPTGVARRDFHRPLDRLVRDVRRAGFAIEAISETGTVDLERFEPAADHLVMILRPEAKPPSVSLAIKGCAMEWETIESQVRHLVGQLDGPCSFVERVLVVDSREEGFARTYARPDRRRLLEAADRLVRQRVIDRVLQPPVDPEEIRALNVRWFGCDTTATHASNGNPTAATCWMFESVKGNYVLQVDADLMICRPARTSEYLSPMLAIFDRDPAAVTVSLSIANNEATPFTPEGPRGPWRVEVRGALMDRQRLLAARPLANSCSGHLLERPWHRALDHAVAAGRCRSYRGGDPALFFVHPPNDRKRNREEWMAVLDRAEAGFVPECQRGHVEWVGTLGDWLGPKRREPFVFIVTGRNVPPGRFLRCLDSITRQRGPWGAVVVDDGSERGVSEFVRHATAPWADRFTVLRTRVRRGSLANTVLAIRHVVESPDAIIVTLDPDDSLIGAGVLERLMEEYDDGADVTVGSMLRTDKQVAYEVDLDAPRRRRGGNVWQHLRSFRKRLFDAIPDEALRLDDRYVELASDWAYMLPIVEMAGSPRWIEDLLYLYEPSGVGKGREREAREAEIGRIVSKPSFELKNGGCR